MATILGDALIFFHDFGLFDVVLPFLLTFTIVYAIFEKTKVFGMEKIDGKEYTKKPLNAMVAFVIGFIVIASSKIVAIITEVSANMVILLLLSVFFMILVGSLYREGEGIFETDKGLRTAFMVVMFVGIIAIFLWAIKKDDGTPWLQWALTWVVEHVTSTFVASVILLVIIIGFMIFITKEPSTKKNKKKTES